MIFEDIQQNANGNSIMISQFGENSRLNSKFRLGFAIGKQQRIQNYNLIRIVCKWIAL